MTDNSYLMAMRNPVLQATNSYASPDTRRFTLEEEYKRIADPQNQPQQSNPYNDYIQTLNSITDITKEKIIRDERFIQIYTQCEALLKEYLYAQIIPTVLQTQQGRIAFEQLYSTTKSLKEEYVQRDVQKERQLELLMQDEVVLRRLQELQNAQSPQPTQTSTQPNQGQMSVSQTPQNTSYQNTNQKQNNFNKNQHRNQQPQPQQGGGVE